MYPTCPSSETISELISFANIDSSDAQKKCTRESSASTEKSSSKKVKRLVERKYRNLEEKASENKTSDFLQLYDKIDSVESKNEDAFQGLIYSYFDFGKAVFKQYKKLKLKHSKDGSQALVKSKVKKAIPKAKCSDKVLRKRIERFEKVYKLFNSIGKEKIAQIKSTSSDFILNLIKNEKDYVIAEILKRKGC
ncbi:hypothetical protein RhiirA5_346050 [Rhizophagus irregularis]|uniref:Uncharacterized protein n=1 Tax=Rhizophagus irregularis TaxID=588596 RepID=A0A2I1EBR9_9GLOM|nr:hypothetical protein RhiirA5_346050 [Rhizophagus irregularis]PKC73666.1 hypothetical protein RhiirA1_410267 [Rhizophagus irregularis]PKY19570.1 hypothetical protein RhiirB3_407017 [Rhizophagus irregularis]